jgi:hypothetical protein
MTVYRMSEHLPQHGTHLVLNSVGHMGMGNVVQQDDAMSGVTLTLFLDLGNRFLSIL